MGYISQMENNRKYNLEQYKGLLCQAKKNKFFILLIFSILLSQTFFIWFFEKSNF